MRILLIEDSRDDADLLALELARAGIDHALHRAGDRDAVLAALRTAAPDVVVCDSRLPLLDGDEAWRLVSQAWPGVPFVFCVGVIDREGPMAEAIAHAHAAVAKDDMARMPDVLRGLLADRRLA